MAPSPRRIAPRCVQVPFFLDALQRIQDSILAHLGRILAYLGLFLGHLGRILAHLGFFDRFWLRFWTHFGTKMEPSWDQNRYKNSIMLKNTVLLLKWEFLKRKHHF